MYRYARNFAVEAFVRIADAGCLVEGFCVKYRDFILSIDIGGADTLVDFGEGKAILRPAPGGLRIRIVSDTLWGYLGCRELLHLHLFDAGLVRDEDYTWMPASDVPFMLRANQESVQRR
ncbi:hypothetical protein [Shinella sp.]|uniref:hypothetical protein n=1 Tax=Shinella sp. TaxID=1870904 RepID=UPI003F72DC2D|nr:hypothetical protein [Pseudomonadota bacterium]